MPTLTPQITLTATLDDITGQPAGSVESPARLVITLCGFGRTLPQIAGTSTLAKLASFEVASTGEEISVALWGNDVIQPIIDGVPQTFYCITVIDGTGNIVQSAVYQFVGTETIDLSNATPYIPVVPPTLSVPLTYGPVSPQPPQGTGVSFTSPGPIVMVFYNGTPQRKGIDWNPVGASITQFTLTFPTFAEENVYALYFS